MDDGPIALVNEVLRRLNSEDWEGAAALCDEGSLSFYRRNFLWRFSTPTRELGVDDYLRMSPDMPREVAEYQAQQHQKYSDPLVRLREELPQVSSVADLQKLAPRELFALWLQAHSPRAQVDRLVEAGQVSRSRADQVLPSVIPMWDYTLIGVVMDGDQVAHVLYRGGPAPDAWNRYEAELVKSGAPEVELEFQRDIFGRDLPSMVTCRRTAQGDWRLVASHHLFGIGSHLMWIGDDETEQAS